MTWRKWFGLVLVAVLPLLLIPALTAAGPTPSTPPLQKIAPALRLKIEPLVLKELASGEKVTYIVHLTQQADLAPARRIKGKIPRRQAVASRLQAVAERSQRDIRAYLDQQQALGKVESYLPFWVFNGLAVTGDLDTLLALAARPEVKAIRANHVRHLPKPAMEPAPEPRAVEWNIAHVRADQVWREFGITGQGVVVANMDTGVDWTHPALQSKYRGADGNHDYNWFDFTGTYPDAPNDGHNHGTHTMGTLVGDDGSGNQIGMAPGARWIAVKIFNDDGSTTDLIIHQGFQWILAPTDLNGENPDPSKAPDVVNNSWGDMNGGDTTFWDDVAAWRAAGIFSPFAAGNEGEMGEGSMDSPGSFPHAVAVGATDRDDLLAYFSSLGPSFWEETKPEVSAPGVDIRSSIPGGYATGDGTSMAAPHAAGLAALLLEADPSLTVDDLENFMKFTALDLGEPGPDNAFGAGRIDAYDAVRWALDAGKLYGQVTASNVKRETSSVKGTGIPGATVNGVNQAGDRFVTTTDATGIYTVSVPYGFYDVTASAFGYLSATVKAVEVITDYMSMRDLALEPSPTGALSGQVTEAGTGEPLAATIRAVGTPALRAEPQGEASTVADASGHYTLTLPVGSYTVEVNLVGYQIQRATASISEGVVTTLNFALPTAPAILLVDADVVFEDNVANYYQRALDEAGYLYYTRLITDTAFIPTAEELGAYDVVIWANPWQSPGFIGADQALMSYLDHGGRLLIAGQDIGYWDGGGNPFQPDPIPFYTNYLHARYLGEPSIVDLLVGRDFLEGVTLALDDPLAYKNTGFCGVLACFYPDEMEPADEAATPIIAYPDGSIRGLKAEYPPYRVVYFGFGLESVGPRDMLARTVGEAISWLSLPSLNKEVDKETALSGEVLTYTLTLTNIGSVDLPGVSLTDPIPEHTSYMSDSVTGGATYDPVLDRIQWSGTLPALSQMTFTFQARIDSPLAGGTVISNTATFDDGQGHTPQASVTTTVVGPNLRGSAKTVDKALALAGDVLTYTITLHNSGPITASDVSLVDPIPDNATYVPDSVTGGATYNPALDQIEWRGDVPALEPGVGPYTWTDSDAPDGPSYEWVDITTIGTAI
ncbi:MAG: S8 family serine peptidase, partial [Anaerolineae bacterium]